MPTSNRIYTDGGCRPNPGRGAFALVVVGPEGTVRYQASKANAHTTNNQMEMWAVLNALRYAQKFPDEQFEIVTDSKYVQNGLTKWVKRWKGNNWLTGGKQPVKNADLWKRLEQLHGSLQNVTIAWTKAHATNDYNNLADALCTNAILGREALTA